VPSPKLVPIVLSDAERASLEALSRKRTASQALALRARIVLACAENGGVAQLTAVAGQTGASRESVRKWRVRFAESRMKGLTGKGPGQDTHWSTGSMAGETGLSQSSVSRIWRAFGLKPHLVETWKLSVDPEFPYLAILPTTPARMTHDYVRHGTTSLFAAYDVTGRSVIAQSYRRHRHQEFLRFLKVIGAAVPKDLDLHLVLDNYATHKTPAIRQWLVKHPRFHLHFTPTSSSWLNLVERWFAELTNRKLRRSAHRSVTELAPARRARTRRTTAFSSE
jgi:transposase